MTLADLESMVRTCYPVSYLKKTHNQVVCTPVEQRRGLSDPNGNPSLFVQISNFPPISLQPQTGIKHVKIIVLIMASIVLNFFTYAEDGKIIYNKFKKIIDDNRNESPMENKGRDFLLQLSKDDFLAFIRELPKSVPGYDEKNIDNVWAMVIFAQIYIEGTG